MKGTAWWHPVAWTLGKNVVCDIDDSAGHFSDRTCHKCPSLPEVEFYLFEDTAFVLMFGIGGVDNSQIYYASPDYDCDQHLWCRWFSFADGKVCILAELEDD